MDDLLQQMFDDVQSVIPTDNDLKIVGQLAQEQVHLESRVNPESIKALVAQNPSVLELEEALKVQKAKLTEIREVKLPEAIQKFGLREFKLNDGTVVAVKDEVYAGITEENRDQAFKWLTETGNDGLIKNEIKCPFSKGQDTEAKKLIDILAQQGFSFTNSRTVHPQTLRAFVRKQIEGGLPIPADLFSIHVKKVASIKLKGAKK